MADEKSVDVRPAIQKLRDAQMALAEAYDAFKEQDPTDQFGLTSFAYVTYNQVSDVIERIDAGEI